MKQFIFKVLNQPGLDGNTNCKRTILIQAKDFADAMTKISDMGFHLIGNKTPGKSQKIPVISFATYHAHRMHATQVLESPEDHN